ncbi:hypothetical protein [Sphingobacterium griseoflavum]|uniref:Uncharacterized protein n=1 Tax=Sphingobacterium griseoflavum TaxID=1474952 RepID=A0ABQ3HWE7_9SPHI|nr:hypothetical protein [Sphingobacterium griseoflavum]GHE31090.1 hypothetical protein GCM10017764_12680 [Sphingobacterium griseoflavum]
MHQIKVNERNENDLVLEVIDAEGVTTMVDVTLFEDGNFNARVGSHHVSDEMRNDINHFLATKKIGYHGD